MKCLKCNFESADYKEVCPACGSDEVDNSEIDSNNICPYCHAKTTSTERCSVCGGNIQDHPANLSPEKLEQMEVFGKKITIIVAIIMICGFAIGAFFLFKNFNGFKPGDLEIRNKAAEKESITENKHTIKTIAKYDTSKINYSIKNTDNDMNAIVYIVHYDGKLNSVSMNNYFSELENDGYIKVDTGEPEVISYAKKEGNYSLVVEIEPNIIVNVSDCVNDNCTFIHEYEHSASYWFIKGDYQKYLYNN